MTETLGPKRWLGAALAIAAWSAVWVALWRLAAALAVNFGISAWYPPAAISLFMLIRYGPAAAPAVFAASLLAGSAQWSPYPGYHEIMGSLGHTIAYLAAATLYRARAGRLRHSIRPRPIALLISAALLGAALASLLGNLNISVASNGDYDLTLDRLVSWTTGDFFGVISLCPVLVFVARDIRCARAGLRRLVWGLATPLACLAVGVALASAFALISGGPNVDFRLVSVVAVGVYSVIVSQVVSPRSAVIYLFMIAILSAVWLSTKAPPEARIEFAIQIATFLVASFTAIYLSMQGMTARVAIMIRRLNIRDLAEQRDALSGRIAAIEAEFAHIAHEFRTPLGGIMGLIDIAEGGIASGRAREQVSRHFDYMRGCVRYLNAIVDDAFDLTRIARSHFEPSISEFDVADLLADLALICETKGCDEVEVPDEGASGRLRVRSDRNRLLQILINLVVNGLRYSDRAGSVRVACSVGARSVTIAVENASTTITKAQLDGYIAGGARTSRSAKGLGIGLPLVGKLAAGIGAQLSTRVSQGVVSISVVVPRA
jgi:signal transduction histidine kinase